MADEPFQLDGVSDWFWSVVAEANLDRSRLTSILNALSPEEIVRFHDEMTEAAVQLTDPPYTDHMGEEVSEDTAKDVAECVVSQGKDFYVDVLTHPEKTPHYRACKNMVTFSGVAGSVYAARFGKSLHA